MHQFFFLEFIIKIKLKYKLKKKRKKVKENANKRVIQFKYGQLYFGYWTFYTNTYTNE